MVGDKRGKRENKDDGKEKEEEEEDPHDEDFKDTSWQNEFRPESEGFRKRS